MKAVILAGGYGTRLGEETNVKPKPMIEIGGKPILWHIMKIYSAHNINEFIICCGYKGDIIKGWADKYNDNNTAWNVEVVDTGIDTMTGGRLKRIQNHIDDTFCLTYGDGVSNVDIKNLISFHKEKKLTAFKHSGFWCPMDTLRDKKHLEELWNSNKAPWKVW